MVVREGELLSLKRTEELEYVRVLERKLIDLPDNFGQPVELVRHGPMGAIFYEEYKKSEGR